MYMLIPDLPIDLLGSEGLAAGTLAVDVEGVGAGAFAGATAA
jgi:hypothetical protein